MICIDIIYCPSIIGKVQWSYYCHYPAYILHKLLHNSVNTAAFSYSYLVYSHLIISFSKVNSKGYNINILFAIYGLYIDNTIPNDLNVLLTKDEMVNRMIVKEMHFFVQASIPSLCAIMTVYFTALVPHTKMICIISYSCKKVLNNIMIVIILPSFVKSKSH